jgi:FkbM family methyltransferase
MIKETVKELYKVLPFKKPVFDVLKMVWKPSESVYRHLHFGGKFKVKVEEGKYFEMYSHHHQIPNEIYWDGLYKNWEGTSLKYWVELVRTAKVVLDIGANDGVYSLVTKATNPNVEVHAFEPSDMFYPRLVENNRINNFNIHCHKLAVSNQDGENLIPTVWGQENQSFPSTTIDSFLNKNKIERLDLVKIDVDWHEVAICEGFRERFKKDKPTLLIEILRDYVAQGIEDNLHTAELGYLYFSIHERKGTIRQMPDMTKRGDNMNFLICQPEVAKSLNLI